MAWPRAGRGKGPHVTDRPDDAGFVAADAIVAVMIAGILLATVYEAADTSFKADRRAWDRRMAGAEAELRLLAAWPQMGRPGRVAADDWSVEARLIEPAEAGVGLCQVTSRVTAPDGRLRAGLQTQRLCAGEPAA